ncbi:galactose oxidase [Pyrenophora tritici-repentis]|uniref:Galactose oxidase n=3 Tax=Pyrenophora tritici-repentis TaxID=45151 RepID=A0A2W1GRF2_9PLEO|nr:galactose oxidase precursor [Pyrenophora tritici-repentis Pt-1C-BFP]KAA8618100.1 galactose oxidase [Pyrenophora tritici-repentis]EDU43973.1 galactose oxidase precursor [Pyrenophora tritici-repentis Pt-1C-BFP]KAG9376451.1 galactose oxidase [Pyrenophora tritici-repentis]KAI0575413.1 galactose oxidase [Pyrenophora tritici-repentis]KAI0591206.1 galactose oxidase [Pyrenophora tritici-repentis]
MQLHKSLAVLSASLLFQFTNALNACPGTDTIFTGSQGIRYRVCPGTDLTGPTVTVKPKIASVEACAKLCDASMDCFKAVYDNRTKDCHFKEVAGLTWVANTRYQVIQAEQVNIARCPQNEWTYHRNRKTYSICPGTDIRGPTEKLWKGVKTFDQCAYLCANWATCKAAVYDVAGLACHIKADARSNTLIWSTDKRYDVMRLNEAPAPAQNGEWSDLIRLPVIPVAAYVVPEYPVSKRLLVFSSWGVDAFGGAGGKTQFADYNFNTGAVSARTVSNTHHDMFCPAMSSLQDGRLVIQGGSDAAKTSVYNPTTNAFISAPDMKMARGYQSSATTSDNRIFTIGGAYSGPRKGKDGEVYDPVTNTWTALPNARVKPMLTTDREGIWREDNHAWLFGWKNASVFQAGPSKAMNWYGTKGTGSQVAAGIRDTIDDAMCGISVMYDATSGKIFSAGGSPDYTNSDANARAHITTIGEPNTPAKVERVADMVYPRGFSNAVVLPDGTVLVTGGQKRSKVFTDDDGALYPELFNPATKSWKTLAPEAVPRNYHSVSILLADGRVFSGGGGLCYVAQGVGRSSANCNKLVDHADGQIFSPPYLFNADGTPAARPTISSLSANSVKVGGKLTIEVEKWVPGLQFTLVRIGSVTHSLNTDQRRVPLSNVNNNANKCTVTLPNDSGILIPGAYYLFVISKEGVPSIARTVQVVLP